MNYHKPSLKKLIKEPKGIDRLFAMNGGKDHTWFSNGHFAIKLADRLVPVELAGFLPTADESDGYKMTGGENGYRAAGGPDISGILPKDPNPITLTNWVNIDPDKRSPNCRLAVFDNGEVSFFDEKYLVPLLKIAEGAKLFSEGPFGAMVGEIDGEPVFLLMSIRATGSMADEGCAIGAASALYKMQAESVA